MKIFCEIEGRERETPCIYELGKMDKGNKNCRACDYFSKSLNPVTKDFIDDHWSDIFLKKNTNEWTRSLFQQLRKGFRDTADPLTAVGIFILTVDKNISPPPEILDWFAKHLKAYYHLRGTKTLDEILGIKGPWKNLFKLEYEKKRDKILLTEVAKLQAHYGVDLKPACQMVVARLKQMKVRKISAREIEDKYRSQRLIYDRIKKGTKKDYDWTMEKKRSYLLQKYPADSIPSSLRRFRSK